MKKLIAAILSTVMILGSACCVSAADTKDQVKTENTKIYAQLKKEEGKETYTVRFIADVAYGEYATDEAWADAKQFGFWCSNVGHMAGENYMGYNIYRSIQANGVTKEAENGYFIVFEVTGVTADAKLYARAMYTDQENSVKQIDNMVMVIMSELIEYSNQEEESSTTGGEEETTAAPEEIVDAYTPVYETYDNGTCVIKQGTYASGNVTVPSTHSDDGKTYTVTGIEQKAFLDCQQLVSITLPNTIQTIGDIAFMNCYNLNNISIQEGVTSLGTKAFYCCYSLQTLTLPSTITTIGNDAFGNCNELTTIYVPNASVASVVNNALASSGLTGVSVVVSSN